MNKVIILDGSKISPQDVVDIAKGSAEIDLDPECEKRMLKCKNVVTSQAQGSTPIYGVNTGFGALSKTRIETDSLELLQENLIRSHACGVGEYLPEEIVRGTMCVLAASLSRAHSGVNPEIIKYISCLLKHNYVPMVPSRGSVGASGDLAPLAHIAQALIGEGVCSMEGSIQNSSNALNNCGLKPLKLTPKSGLALLNGTHLMTALLSISIVEIQKLINAAIAATALAIDGCRASSKPFDPRIHNLRQQHGQIKIGEKLYNLLKGSSIGDSHYENDSRIQDPYSFRAAPQILGACLDQIEHGEKIIKNELGAVTDNPLVFPEYNSLLSGANFHGMPLAITADTLKITLAHIAGISERRIYWALSGHDKDNNLPPFLAKNPGLESGLMITQYAAASCVTELRQLASPASVGNVPTCAGIEDYNSQGATAALQLRDSIELAAQVIAIEFLVMAEALDFQRPLTSTKHIEKIYNKIRKICPPFTKDRSPSDSIKIIAINIQKGFMDSF